MIVAKNCRIRITSGAYAGRYVGLLHSGVGLVTNPELLENPPVNIPEAGYGLWAQQRSASVFLNPEAADSAQKVLKALGYDSELEMV
jgi:hypothetical protein